MERKAYSYVRFSSGKQSSGESLRRQTSGAEAYAKKKGWILDTTLTLHDLGVSGWKGDNADTGALAEFISACKRGMVPKGSVLIIEHLDRLTRQQVRPALELFFGILNCGVNIVTLEPEREYKSESNDAISILEPLFIFAAANEKSETLSMRLRDVWQAKRNRRAPMTSVAPCWLRLAEDGRSYDVIEEKAEVVRQIVGLALDGYGDTRIVKKLNDEKWPVITGHRVWTGAFVSKLLRSPSLIGGFEPAVRDGKKIKKTGELWEDYYPAIITKHQWFLLRSQRKARTKRKGPVGKNVANLFSGLITNLRDGEQFHRYIKDHPRLISAAYRNGLSGGDTTTFPYVPVEKRILGDLAREIELGRILGIEDVSEDTELEALRAELEDVEGRISQIGERIMSDPSIGALLDVMATLDARRKDLKNKIAEQETRTAEYLGAGEVIYALLTWQKFEESADDEHTRTKIRNQIRMLVSGITMCVFGEKRSKFKSALLQVYLKSGQMYTCIVRCVIDREVTDDQIKLQFKLDDFNIDMRNWKTDENARTAMDEFERMHREWASSQMRYPEQKKYKD